MTHPSFELSDAMGLDVRVSPGFPEIHEAYRTLRDQKDMVCGPYTLTYLCRGFGIQEYAGGPLTVDHVAKEAGTALEQRHSERDRSIKTQIDRGEITPDQAKVRYMHDYFDVDLQQAPEGGTSAKGLVEACKTVSHGDLTAIPIPSEGDGGVQLSTERFEQLLDAMLSGGLPFQMVFNYHLGEILAPASLLGHKYNLVSLLTQWDDPEYFRRLDWNVGHFTTLAGRIEREGSDVRYLLIRDSYKTLGWNGYHLQPESYILKGLLREDDHREGGILLVGPTSMRDEAMNLLESLGLETGIWDNGSPYLPPDS